MLLFLLPFVGALLTFVIPGLSDENRKRFAVLLSLLPLVLLIYAHSNLIGSAVQYDWLPALSIQFYLRVDELSLLFLYLTALIIPISLMAVKPSGVVSNGTFFGLVLLLQGLLIGFFTARDLVLFTIFWEGMLFPLYFIIVMWGGWQRQAAALKFLIYMIAGSVLMVVAVLGIYVGTASTQQGGTFNLDELAGIAGALPYAPWFCAIFLLAFAVKTPLFPFHGWLPDAYYEAPLSGTILLSALLSKAGIYGILRVGMELFPRYIEMWSPWLLTLAVVGVLYGGLAAWRQNDFKRLIAYSSFSHVNFILAGLFVMSQVAHSGAILQAINHGITIAALFLAAGWLEDRLGGTKMGQSSGLAKYMPKLCWLTLVFVLSSAALPGTNSFIGELLILFGLFGVNPWMAGVLGLTVILTVIYSLRWMQKMYFETPSPFQESWIDLKLREFVVALPLLVLILWIGIYPAPVLRYTEKAAEKTMTLATETKPHG